jgi:hypothetical protein
MRRHKRASAMEMARFHPNANQTQAFFGGDTADWLPGPRSKI